jgi:Raf kinase inhibitor-like YbhB/YbcL family protein
LSEELCLSRCKRAARRAVAMATTAAAAFVLGGCGLLAGPTALQQADPENITVTSPEFGQGVAIPRQYTCRGHGVSPPISWSGGPDGTKTLALVMDDADAPISPYVYWIVFNINPATPDIQAHLPPGAVEAVNSKGIVGYTPPCPSRSHQYRFTVYALNETVPLRSGTNLASALTAIASHAIGWGRLQDAVNP